VRRLVNMTAITVVDANKALHVAKSVSREA
jgi:hypothetical protein